MTGQQKKHYLAQHLNIKGVDQLKHGILWEVRCTEQKPEEVLEYLMHCPVLFNPYSQDCFFWIKYVVN